MPATDRQKMFRDTFSPLGGGALRQIRKSSRRAFAFSSFAGLVLLAVFACGCPPPARDGGDGSRSGAPSSDLPELTEELIRERINDAWVREVPEENGAAEPISWNFDEQEPKEITVVEKQIEGVRATIVLDIKTRSAQNMRNPRALAGQIRTEWELKTGWALRKWEIVGTENISMKYRNLPKPLSQNSNR